MKALITGISGFAGSYLTEFLIKKGYQVCCVLSLHQEIDSLVEVFINNKNLFNINNLANLKGEYNG